MSSMKSTSLQFFRLATIATACFASVCPARAEDSDRIFPVKDAYATKPEEMKKYVELIEHTCAKIEMIPFAGG